MTAGVTTADPKEFAVDCAPSTVAPGVRQRQSVLSVERHAVAALVLVVMLGFALRIRGLDRAGFNEDEVQKVNAAHAYLHGDFSRNLEHPMLMKSMVAVSLAGLLLLCSGEEGQRDPGSTARGAVCEMVRRRWRKLWLDAGFKIFSPLSGSNFHLLLPALEQKGISTALQAGLRAPAGHMRPGVLDRQPSHSCSRHYPIHAALRWGRHDDPSRRLDDGTFLFQ